MLSLSNHQGVGTIPVASHGADKVPEIPKLLADFTAAINRGDTPAFLDCFASDGVVDDWGRRFVGHDGIKRWSDAETIGAHGTLTITNVIAADRHKIVADTFWKS